MGKMAFFLVLGFSVIFLVMGYNANDVSTRAVENMADYHAKTVAYNIAVSGANMAANNIFLDGTWKTGYSNINFEDGQLSATVEVLDAFKNIRKLTSTGSYRGVNKSVEVIFQPSSFSKFAYYSVSESGIHWKDGDTVWGPWHSQDYITISKKPVFYGKVTTKKGIKWNIGPYDPKFYGGFEQGVDVTMPATSMTNLESMAADDGKKFTGKDTLYLTFAGDSIKFRSRINKPDSTFLLSTFAPNGVIYAKDAILRLKGTIKGQYTVGSNKRIYIDNDIVYNTNPLTNPNSTDLFGIVTEKDVLVTNNAANNNGINLHASIYCRTEGFGAENPDTRPNSGQLKLLGGIQQYYRKLVSDPWPTHGFAKAYRYDQRLMFASPPGYPGTGQLEIVSWFE
jgi:hypothetical protein